MQRILHRKVLGGVVGVAALVLMAATASSAFASGQTATSTSSFGPLPDLGSLPTSVIVGNETVPVSSDGTITVDGYTIPILPGAKRVVLPTSSTGSATTTTTSTTSSGSQTTTSSSTSSTSTVVNTVSTADNGCELNTVAPAKVGGVKQVRGSAHVLKCSAIYLNEVGISVYSSPSSGKYRWTLRGQDTAYGDGDKPVASVQTACGKNRYWHTNGYLASEDTVTGDEFYTLNKSRNRFVPCLTA